MRQISVTVMLPEKLYTHSQRLVEEGLFANFDEVVTSGLRSELYKRAVMLQAPSDLSDGEKWTYYAEGISAEIDKMGGLGLGETQEEIIEALRQTRQQIWEEKYAAHFGHE